MPGGIDPEFVGLVARMRAAQVAYFRSSLSAVRNPDEGTYVRERAAALEESKRLEREVDLYIRRYHEPRAEPSLFDKMEAPR